MKKLAILFCLMPFMLHAQNEFNQWIFGDFSAISFNSGSPQSFSGSPINTDEGVASVCDASGQLLFCTDGLTVWDRNFSPMPNGTSLLGGFSSTQSATIVPKPGGNGNLFYIITAPQQFTANPIAYSIVDMTLNGGLGDIVSSTKNTTLAPSITEKVTAIRHSNGTDIWILANTSSNEYDAFLLSSAGFSPTPVISFVGLTPSFDFQIGYLKASPCNDKIACAEWMDNILQLMDFDNSTGVVSNAIVLPIDSMATSGVYGVEFSSDGSKLYSSIITPASVFQYDLNAGSSVAIAASATVIGISPNDFNGALQLGPDEKIYLSKYHDSTLACIQFPNLGPASCGYVEQAVHLTGVGSLGLPDYVDKFNCSQVPATAAFECDDSYLCAGTCINFNNLSNNGTSFQWILPGATPSLSTDFEPQNVCYPNAGTFDVTLISSNSAGSDTMYLQDLVVVDPPLLPPVIQFGGSFLYTNSNPFYDGFEWCLNGTPISSGTDTFFFPTVPGDYTVRVTDHSGCTAESSPLLFTGILDLDDVAIPLFKLQDGVLTCEKRNGSKSPSAIQLFNSLGQEIFHSISNSKIGLQEDKWYTSCLSKALYIIRVEIDGKTYSGKLLND